MTNSSDCVSTPTMITERVRLPDNPGPGRYNSRGEEDPSGGVFVVRVGPTAHAWAVFEHNLLPNQRAAMVFENVSDSGILDSIVCQWIKGGSGAMGENFNHPHVGEAVINHLARQRAQGAVKVVGLNSWHAEVSAAAALLYIPGSGG